MHVQVTRPAVDVIPLAGKTSSDVGVIAIGINIASRAVEADGIAIDGKGGYLITGIINLDILATIVVIVIGCAEGQHHIGIIVTVILKLLS